MAHSGVIEIKQYEQRLKEAMLQSDVAELDRLLAEDLVFTNHLGHLMSKQDDLLVHKSKIIKINNLTLSEQNIKIYNNTAIVTVKAFIAGTFNGNESENNFRFTRVWNKEPDKEWQLTASHACVIVEEPVVQIQ